MSVGPKLRWVKEEEKRVLVQAMELRRKEPELSMSDSLYRGQEVLDERRRKQRFTHHYKQALLGRLQTLEQKIRSAEGTVPMPTPEQLAPPPTAPAPTAPLTAVDHINAVLPLLGSALERLVVKLLAPAIAQAAVEAVRHLQPPAKANGNGLHIESPEQINSSGGTTALEQVAKSALPEKFVRHKVAILQLNGTQQQEIAGRFPHLDFRFLMNDHAAKHIQQVAGGCEATFVMTKFTAHKAQKALPRDNRNYVNGGISDLARVLELKFPRTMSMDPVQH